MTADEGREPESLKGGVARGAAWMVAMRLTIRAIGVVNIIIVARLVTPEDFGIIAMATVLVGILEAMAEIGVAAPLLRNRTAGREHYDSAWTLQVIAGLLKAALIIASAQPFAAYYGDPRVETVLYIIALRPALDGFENIGQVNFRRDLQFDKEFRYWVYRRLLSFFLTIGLVLWLRNYIALALMAPITGAATVLLSYIMSPYRPRFATSHIGEIWAFSKWMMLVSGLGFFGRRGEELILGRVTTPEVVGAYYVGGDFAGQLTKGVVSAIDRAMLPNYARVSGDPKHLQRGFQLSLGLIATICLAAGVGASLLAEDLVLALLGGQWHIAVPFFQWLALNGAFVGIVGAMTPLLIVLRQERLVALRTIAYITVLIPTLFVAAYTAEAETVAMARTAVGLLYMVAMLAVLIALRVFTLARMLDLFWRPVIATAVMAACVSSLDVSGSHIVTLAIRIPAGVVAFSATHVLLWLITGRPSGVETALLSLAGDYVARVRRRRRTI
jgi:lipopolysaccharide exporter